MDIGFIVDQQLHNVEVTILTCSGKCVMKQSRMFRSAFRYRFTNLL
jgi:hypothetical protein